MTEMITSGETRSDDAADLLRRVRQTDPTADEEAVRRYAREIAEADAVLKGIDLNNALPVAAFTPVWDIEHER